MDGSQLDTTAEGQGLDAPFDYMNHPASTAPDAPTSFGRFIPPPLAAKAYTLDLVALIDAKFRVAVGTDLTEVRNAFRAKYGDTPKSPYSFFEWESPVFQVAANLQRIET